MPLNLSFVPSQACKSLLSLAEGNSPSCLPPAEQWPCPTASVTSATPSSAPASVLPSPTRKRGRGEPRDTTAEGVLSRYHHTLICLPGTLVPSCPGARLNPSAPGLGAHPAHPEGQGTGWNIRAWPCPPHLPALPVSLTWRWLAMSVWRCSFSPASRRLTSPSSSARMSPGGGSPPAVTAAAPRRSSHRDSSASSASKRFSRDWKRARSRCSPCSDKIRVCCSPPGKCLLHRTPVKGDPHHPFPSQ